MTRWLIHYGLWALCGFCGLTSQPTAAAAGVIPGDLSESRVTPWYLANAEQQWVIDLGLELGFEPDYVGSDDYEIEVFPYLAAYYLPSDNVRLRLTPESLGVTWDPTPNTLLQLVLEREEGREAGETSDLTALDDEPTTTEAELTLAHRFGKGDRSFVYATYQPEIQDRGKGVVYFVGAGRQWRPRAGLTLTLVADVSWGDEEHMEREFGLPIAAASRLSLPAYAARGGIKSTTWSLVSEWQLSRRWDLITTVEVEYYFQEAADSPLLDDLGSALTYEVEAALVYRF